MKFVNENINDILKPKNKEQIDLLIEKKFKEITGISIKEAKELVEKLNTLGCYANFRINITPTYISNSPIEIKQYRLLDYNHVIAECPLKEMANKLLLNYRKYTIKNNLDIIDAEENMPTYLTINETKDLINKIELYYKENK
jgi:hypothetical protein